jgi:hypothetical protein
MSRPSSSNGIRVLRWQIGGHRWLAGGNPRKGKASHRGHGGNRGRIGVGGREELWWTPLACGREPAQGEGIAEVTEGEAGALRLYTEVSRSISWLVGFLALSAIAVRKEEYWHRDPDAGGTQRYRTSLPQSRYQE